MTTIRIEGGKPLSGILSIGPNKNAVLPVLCATILTKESCILKNVPKSPDVLKILEAIQDLGGTVVWNNESTLTICCANVQNKPVSDCVKDIQSAILFVGPLLARFGKADVPVAIGCKLGYRGPEDHIMYLSKLGATCTLSQGRIIFSVNHEELRDQKLTGNYSETRTKNFMFSEASVTPTENLLMLLSTVTKFNVELQGIAQEPHVHFLVSVLEKMGMVIHGKGSVLKTEGYLKNLKGFECDFAEEPDFVEVYGTAVMVALTGGEVHLLCAPTQTIHHMIDFLQEVGIACGITSTGVTIRGTESKFNPVPGFPKANATVWKLNPKPWPGFPVDCLPSFIAWSCSNSRPLTGVTVNDWMYEEGLTYVAKLRALGAKIIEFSNSLGSQKILIEGQHTPEGSYLQSPGQREIRISSVPVIEGTRAIVSLALARNGVTVLEGVEPLLRRSPTFINDFQKLGAHIEIV